MILVNTSVWVDHLRVGDPALARELEVGSVLLHPHVLGELACGNLKDRAAVLGALRELARAPLSPEEEVLAFIESHGLMGRGLGYVDVHLLASALSEGAALWTHDRRLAGIAAEMGAGFAAGM